ncbi:hypothetical protein J6590_052002 [Homalodisca vitripennis]|nr:hypothetical protein J6590_052002 [Homalodisca vitripennis]
MVTQHYLNVACLSVSRLVVTAVTQYLKVVLFAVPRRLQLLFEITQYLQPSSRNGNTLLSQRQCLGVSRLVVTAVTQYLKVVLFAVPRRLQLLFGITQYLEPSSRNGNPVLSQRPCLGVSRLVVTAVTQYLKVVLFAVPRRLQLLFGITQYLEPSSRNGNPVLSQRPCLGVSRLVVTAVTQYLKVVLFAVPQRLKLLFGITQYLEPILVVTQYYLNCLKAGCYSSNQYLKVVLFAVPRRLKLLFGITQYLEPVLVNPVLSQRRVSQCLKAGCYSSNSVSQGRIVRRTSASPAALRDNPVSRAQFSQCVSRLVVTAVTQYLKVVLFAVPRRLQLLFGITQYLEPSSRNGNPVLSQRPCLSVSRLVVTAVTQYLKVVLFAVPRRLQLLFGITQYLEPSSRNGNPVLSQRPCLGVSRLVVTAVTQYLKVVLFAVPRRLQLLFGITQYLEPSSRNGNPVLSQRRVSQCLKAGCYSSNSVSQGRIVRRTSSQAALRDNPVSRAQFSQW